MKKVSIWPVLALILVLGAAVLSQSLFVVREGQQAIILQFGEHIRTIKEPGLHFRTPFIQTPIFFDAAVLMADGRADEYLTLDKKRLFVDHISRWRIVDPLTFYQAVTTEAGALARLDQIITSRLKQEIAKHDFLQVIREQRESIMRAVTDDAKVLAREFGIEVLDVRIKRLDLPQEVQESVFARMEAERRRIALRYRLPRVRRPPERSGHLRTKSERSSSRQPTNRQSESAAKATPGPPASTPRRTARIPTFTAS